MYRSTYCDRAVFATITAMSKPLRLMFAACLAFSLHSKAWSAENIPLRDDLQLTDADRTILSNFVEHAVAHVRGLESDSIFKKCLEAPEMFAWIDFPYLDCLLVSYELTLDPMYLDLFAEGFAKYEQLLRPLPPDPHTIKDSETFLGWWGKPIKDRILPDQPELLIDEIQMNFRAMSILAEWVRLVRSNETLAQTHEETCKRYLVLMQDHLFPKWDARGHYVDLGANGGVYRGLDFPIPTKITLSHEKLSLIVDGLLKLHVVSQDDRYLTRAIALGTWLKTRLVLKNDHYEWMSWEPSGDWDKAPDKDNAWRVSWMAPDPNGGWYQAGMSTVVRLYRCGLVFDKTDLDRFLVTQKAKCWNGDMNAPVYYNVAGESSKWIKGRFLSLHLANYDEVLGQLAFRGPHEAQHLEDSSNSWKGGANAREYIREKYLTPLHMTQGIHDHAAIGTAYLSKEPNALQYEKLVHIVTEGSHQPPLTPSAFSALNGDCK
jgi:hypothetical protein